MPSTRSAKKAERQNKRRKVRNLAKRRAISETKKKVRAAKSPEDAKELLRRLYKAADKAVKTGAIKKGKGNRIKSRLAKSLKG